MDFALNAIPGLAIAAGLYFVYLVATKGLPAALSWVKAKWNAGRAELETLHDDVDHAYQRLGALEAQVKKLTDRLNGAPAAQAQPVPQPAPQPAPTPAAAQ